MAYRGLVGRNSSRIDRCIRMAFNNAKAKIPVDTGSLRDSLTLNKTPYGYKISFNGNFPYRKNPNKKVRDYIDYVEIYHSNWWENYTSTFYAEMANLTGGTLK